MDTDQNIYEYRILNRKCYENIDSSIFFKHFHDFYELYVFVSGEGYYTIESKVYQLRPYDAFLIQPAQYHFLTLTNTTHYERILIWFSDKDVPSSLLDSFGNKNIYVNIKDKPILNNLFFGPYWDTFSTYSRSDLEILSQLKLKEFLIHLKNTDTLSSASEHVSINPIVKKALKYINENLSEDLNIKKNCRRSFCVLFLFVASVSKHLQNKHNGICATEKSSCRQRVDKIRMYANRSFQKIWL